MSAAQGALYTVQVDPSAPARVARELAVALAEREQPDAAREW